MRIKGKNIIVTGASSGIGEAISLSLGKHCARIAIVARRRDKLEALAGQLASFGTNALVCPCDVADADQVSKTYAYIARQWPSVDILINAAGMGIWKPFLAISDVEHRHMMDVNYWGAYHWIRAVLPDMVGGNSKSIVNISSGAGKMAFGSTSGYSASKFALTGLTESLYREYRSSNVSFSCIHPGSVKTAFWNDSNIPKRHIPALVRYSPKLSPKAIVREVKLSIWLGLPSRITPIFVWFLIKINALWLRLGDLLLWKWFFPLVFAYLLFRIGRAIIF